MCWSYQQVYNVHTVNMLLVGLLAMLQGLTGTCLCVCVCVLDDLPSSPLFNSSLPWKGMTYGLVISSLCSDETSAIQIMVGSFYPILVLSG